MVVGAPSLVFLLSRRSEVARIVSEQLEAVDREVEIHLLDTEERLVTHAREATPDVVLLDLDGVPPRTLMHLLAHSELARCQLIALDPAPSESRRGEALRAGVAQYLAWSPAAGPELVRAFVEARRAPPLQGYVAETEAYYDAILEASSDGVFVLVDGQFHYANSSFAASVGRAARELMHKHSFIDLVPPLHLARIAAQLARVAVGSGAREVFDVALTTAGERFLRFEVACRAALVRGRRAIVGVARDVTALRELMDELEGTRQRDTQFEQLRALGELAAGVAHDFNNTLEAILARVTQAQKKLETGTHPTDDLTLIERAAREAATMVRRIRDFGKPRDPEDWGTADLAAVVQHAVELVRPRVPERIRLEIATAPVPPIVGSASELGEVLVNLLNNAVDAIEAQGHIRVRTYTDGEDAVVVVEDDGTGISAELQKKIFEPYFTTKQARGTGLGLSVSQSILRRHDAQLQLESAPGRGTTFRLVFSPVGTPARAPANVTTRSLSILVVEDDASILELIREVLEGLGHRVTTTTEPTECLGLLEAASPHVLVTDLDLPGTSGWQLARRVREKRPDIIVGLITGWPLGASSEELHAKGVDFVLGKPFTTDALAQAIANVSATSGQ